MNTIKKILILGYVWPEPNSSAAGSRTMALLRLFRQQQWEVVFASAAALSSHRAGLPQLGVREQIIALNCDSFDDYLSGYQPDVVVFDRFFTEEQFGWRVETVCPQALRVLDTIDLHSLRDARQHLLKLAQKDGGNEAERNRVDPPQASFTNLRQIMTSSDLAQREIAALYRSDLTLMISDAEMQLLQEQFDVPTSLLHYCNLMLADAPTLNDEIDCETRQHFISIGNFRHAPNWDAVLWLKHAIWPLIRRELPQAQLHIYGAYPPPKASALHDARQGFHMLGWVDDAHRVMRAARVCLAPLRFGAGIKGKLADALTCATPSVTTSIGSEGMTGGLPWAGAVCDSAEEFARAAVSLYQDDAAWRVAQQRGTSILQTHFCRDTSESALIVRLNDSVARLEQLRGENFIGQMLRHHSHKSTQYMAQWIAAKNAAVAKPGAI